MKKLICVVALCLTSPFTFADEAPFVADEAAIQRVLDSVHSKGFVGCDNEIREHFKASTAISFVEAKMPFIQDSGKDKVVIDDEVIIYYGSPGYKKEGWEGSINSTIVRKVGKECHIADDINVMSSTKRNCIQEAQKRGQDEHNSVLTKVDGSIWSRSSDPYPNFPQSQGNQYIYTPLKDGSCRVIGLPYDWSYMRKK